MGKACFHTIMKQAFLVVLLLQLSTYDYHKIRQIAYIVRNHPYGAAMKKMAEKMNLPLDVSENATIVNVYGNKSALIENYKSIIEYTPNHVKLQGKHVKLLIEGENLQIDYFSAEDCKVCGEITSVQYFQI